MGRLFVAAMPGLPEMPPARWPVVAHLKSRLPRCPRPVAGGGPLEFLEVVSVWQRGSALVVPGTRCWRSCPADQVSGVLDVRRSRHASSKDTRPFRRRG
jgi:hypothetical protein